MTTFIVFIVSALVNSGIVGIASRSMMRRHKNALRQMQTALWNDRQLRQGKPAGKVVSGE